jgi:methylated-DNA-[protein]-cysteine S-methyltransferase
MAKLYTLTGADGRPYGSERPGTLAGHRRNRIYGRLDCPAALRAIARGHYVAHRVFFADAASARAAGYRPCAVCLPIDYKSFQLARTQMLYTICDSPLGPLLLAGDEAALTRVTFADEGGAPASWRRNDARFAAERRQLQEYFAGARSTFDVPLRLEGSPFQRRVWDALRGVAYATTTTYGEIAAQLGYGAAPRAVGAANGANPIAIIVPCHRVIGAGGKLTGYAGGLDRKRALLAHEGVLLYAA